MRLGAFIYPIDAIERRAFGLKALGRDDLRKEGGGLPVAGAADGAAGDIYAQPGEVLVCLGGEVDVIHGGGKRIGSRELGKENG